VSDAFGSLFRAALARRLAAQPEAVRDRLQQKIDAIGAPREREALPASPRQASECAPLAELNAWLRTARQAVAEPPAEGEVHDPEELASVRRFRRAWDRSRALERLQDAAARRPAHAGPLNSHMLVLRSLDLMRELSPDYLRRFLVQLEGLQWLEDVPARLPRGKAPARTKRKK
jgi:hypothetical protein